MIQLFQAGPLNAKGLHTTLNANFKNVQPRYMSLLDLRWSIKVKTRTVMPSVCLSTNTIDRDARKSKNPNQLNK